MTRTRAPLLVSVIAASLAASGCSERALTQLVVVADTDLLVPSQVDRIEIVIEPPVDAPVERSGALDGTDAIELPASLGVVHGGGPLGPVRIHARALRGAELIVERDAEVFFVEGHTLVLPIHLEAACVGIPCEDEETCEHGECRPVVVTRDELVDFDGMVPRLPDGGGGCVMVPEICNLADDDCDERIDEGVDVTRNPLHCGLCDNACPSRPNARPACAASLCTVECLTGYGDCNRDPRDGCEVQLNTLAMCSACNVECMTSHGAPTCFLGTCEVQTCAPGWGDCNELGVDGCEAPLNEPTHCGTCSPCSVPGAVESCVDGTCGIAACEPGLGDCNGMLGDGCEAPLDTVAACGACGRSCGTVAAGVMGCVSGDCVVASCNTGYADCDGSVSNGCETRLDTMSDCGSCGTPCALDHASETCGVRGCEIGTCDAGWDDCDGLASNGCETSLETSVDCGVCDVACSGATPLCGRAGTARNCVSSCTGTMTMCGASCVDTNVSEVHCGLCDRACAPAHAVGECRTGSCAVASCDPGWGDCNGLPGDGCERPLDTMADCGACGSACSLAFAGEHCDAGRCVLDTCDAGHGNCDGTATTGCEVPLVSTADCGGCGVTCNLPQATESCATGTCRIVACAPGRADCNGIASDGCETPLGSLTDCRACGDSCDVPRATESCAAGTCTRLACDGGWGDCDAVAPGCETSLNSVTHCGACGVHCGPFDNATASCATSTCNFTCLPGWDDCDGVMANGCETPLDTASHCGSCTTVCSGGTPNCAPSGGGVTCQSGCEAGQTLCGTVCVDLLTSEAHCGGCDVPCAPPASVGSCVAGSCRIESCDPGLGDCNTSVTDGCERDLRTTSDCDVCGASCGPFPSATASCSTGSCEVMCLPLRGDCDGSTSNGCERALDTTSSCGGCDAACPLVANATEACNAGVCEIGGCTAGYDDCNEIYSDGCETNLLTQDMDCGECGHACEAGEACMDGVCATP